MHKQYTLGDVESLQVQFKERQKGYEDFMNHFQFDPNATVEWQDGWTYALYNNSLALKAKKLANNYIEEIK